jgi:glycogen synthase
MYFRLLFVTSEIDDYVRTGGLAAVAAALPRVLREWTDTRVLLPGYPEVLRKLANIEILGVALRTVRCRNANWDLAARPTAFLFM